MQVLGNGALRALVTLNDRSAPDSYAFAFELPAGAALVPNDQVGGLAVTVADGTIVMGRIAAPWAKDAAGHSLPTRYIVRGTTVVQQIDLTGARFPVVADPEFVYNCGLTSCNWTFNRNYTRHQLKSFVEAGSAAVGVAGTVICAELTGPIVVACVAYLAISVAEAIVAIIDP